MPNPLTEGPAPNKLRIKKALKILKGAILTVESGGRLNIATGGKLQTAVEALPATCVVGELISNSADGNKLYQCTTTNTWTKVGTQV